MTMYNWPDIDQEPNTTYKSEGVHKNRPESAKMNLEPMDREGVTDSEKMAMAEAAAAAVEPEQPKPIGVDERVAISRREPDVASQAASAAHSTAAAATSRVEPGGWRLPTPGMGTQASYGDGVPAGQGGSATNVNVNLSYSGGEGGEGGGMSMGGMDMGSMMGGGGGSGGGGGTPGGGAISSQIGQDIAAMDDEIDQATEALFQDDTVRMAHQRMGEKLQGR